MSIPTPVQLPPDVSPANKNLMAAFPVTLADGTTSLVQAVVLADAAGRLVGTEGGGLAVGTSGIEELLRGVIERLDILIELTEGNQ